MKMEAVIFDLDGTLLDTIQDLNASCNYALAQYHYPSNTIEETRCFIGNGIRKLVERSLKGNLEHIEEVFALFKKHYEENYNTYTKVYDGVYEFLKYCKTKQIPMGIVSNKNQGILSQLCELYFKDYIEVWIGDTPSIERKPSIMGLELCCKKLNVSLPNVLYIGDSMVDAKTIQNAKCKGALMTYGFGKIEDLETTGIFLCDSMVELKKIFEE